jgi:hypothetical protein
LFGVNYNDSSFEDFRGRAQTKSWVRVSFS